MALRYRTSPLSVEACRGSTVLISRINDVHEHGVKFILGTKTRSLSSSKLGSGFSAEFEVSVQL